MTLQFAPQPWKDGTNLDDWFAAVREASTDETQHLTIVTAWAKRSGLALIREDFAAVRVGGGSVAMIVGISEGGASRQGLELALELCDTLEVFHDPSGRTFHPKVYLSRGQSSSHLFVGSNNLTAGGIFRNYEAGLVFVSATDNPVIAQVEQWFEQLRSEAECCVHLTSETLAAIIANESYRIGDEDITRSSSGSGVDVGSVERRVFGASRSRKKGPRGTSLAATGGESVDDDEQAAASVSGHVLRRWSKKLKRTDAQQLGGSGTTHLTADLRLTKSGHELDQTTYFRYEFLGREIWQADPEKPSVDYTVVDIDVIVLGNPLGVMSFRIDHDVTREAGQHNFTTVLKWGPMNALLRLTSYVDKWVLLEALTNGYRLEIVEDDPDTKSASPLMRLDFLRAVSMKSGLRPAVCGCCESVSDGPSFSWLRKPASDAFDLLVEPVVALAASVGDANIQPFPVRGEASSGRSSACVGRGPVCTTSV